MAVMEEEERALLDEESRTKDHGDPARKPLPALCDPQRLAHRLLVLALMCFLGFGSYFCYDNPAALQAQVQRDMKINTADFMELYAWYSWPNVFLCFFGGFLIDRIFGIRSCQIFSGPGDLIWNTESVNGLGHVRKSLKVAPLLKTPYPEALNLFLVWMVTSGDLENQNCLRQREL